MRGQPVAFGARREAKATKLDQLWPTDAARNRFGSAQSTCAPQLGGPAASARNAINNAPAADRPRAHLFYFDPAWRPSLATGRGGRNGRRFAPIRHARRERGAKTIAGGCSFSPFSSNACKISCLLAGRRFCAAPQRPIPQRALDATLDGQRATSCTCPARNIFYLVLRAGALMQLAPTSSAPLEAGGQIASGARNVVLRQPRCVESDRRRLPANYGHRTSSLRTRARVRRALQLAPICPRFICQPPWATLFASFFSRKEKLATAPAGARARALHATQRNATHNNNA